MGFKLLGVMVVIMGVMTGGFYWYYTTSQTRIEQLNKNIATTKSALEQSEAAIESIKTSLDKRDTELERVNREFSRAREQIRSLEERLSKHEIGALAESKPKLVENAINNATDKAFRCFEILSGAELTDDERNAKDGKTFNSECPWLWPGNSD